MCLSFENVQNIIIGTYLSVNDEEQRLVGHVPIELSFLLCKFLACDGCRLEFTPTGLRYIEDGLVVPGRALVWRRTRDEDSGEIQKKLLGVLSHAQ